MVIAGHDRNGVPDPEPPEPCRAAPDCAGARGICPEHDLPYPDAQHISAKLTNLAARAFRDHETELALEYLDRAAEHPDRPYDRILKGYRMIDRAMFRTDVHRDYCGCGDRLAGGNGVPCIHLIRAGCPYVEIIAN